MSGRNWGDAVIDGSTLVFNVAGKPAFRIPLTDVGQVTSTVHNLSRSNRAAIGHALRCSLVKMCRTSLLRCELIRLHCSHLLPCAVHY